MGKKTFFKSLLVGREKKNLSFIGEIEKAWLSSCMYVYAEQKEKQKD